MYSLPPSDYKLRERRDRVWFVFPHNVIEYMPFQVKMLSWSESGRWGWWGVILPGSSFYTFQCPSPPQSWLWKRQPVWWEKDRGRQESWVPVLTLPLRELRTSPHLTQAVPRWSLRCLPVLMFFESVNSLRVSLLVLVCWGRHNKYRRLTQQKCISCTRIRCRQIPVGASLLGFSSV